MSSENKEKVQSPVNPLAILDSLKPVESIKVDSMYLPKFSIFYPIQAGDSENPDAAMWHAYLGEGKDMTNQFFKKPYSFTVIGVRSAMKAPAVGGSGGEYLRAFTDTKTEEGKATLEKIKNSAKAQAGYVALIALFPSDDEDSVAVATMELYKTNLSYWEPVIKQAAFGQKKMAHVTLIDHKKNTVKKGTNHFLGQSPAIKEDYTVKEISREQIDMLKAALIAAKAKVERFMNE